MTENKKLYSQAAITIATFFGAPLAAGVLIRRNCINLGNEKQGLYALLIGIASTIAVFVGVFSLSEENLDKIPQFIIPAIYTAIIYFIVDKIHGEVLTQHKESNQPFYSNWRAIGIGMGCLAIILAIIFAYIYLMEETYPEEYEQAISVFIENEDKALILFDMLNSSPDHEVIDFIEQTGIPAWEENVEIINQLNKIEYLPDYLRQSNDLLLEYCKLRIQYYQIVIKSITEKNNFYNYQLIDLNYEIERILDSL